MEARGNDVNGAGRRWPNVPDFAVPAILAPAQLGATWALSKGADEPFSHNAWIVIICASIGSCVILIWRRVAPVQVLAATVLIGNATMITVGSPEALVSGLNDGIALYSLAVHRDRRVAMVGGAGAITASGVAMLVTAHDGAVDLLLSEVLGTLFYVVITALGQIRRQYKSRRRELAARLAEADREQREAAQAERERLARDLHDVAGHHLSAVVVHSGAAARMNDPDLTEKALTAAADTGRDVLDALTRLVDVVGPDTGEGLDALLPPLCQGLARLGIPITLAIEGRPRRLRHQVSTAAYRIAQESLTNAMRYAPGAPITVEVCYVPGALELSIVNQAPPELGTVPSLGTGRGIAGMRDRAEKLKGAVTAGPTDADGWEVRARLPTTVATTRRGPGWPEVLDASIIALCASVPCLMAFSPPEPLLGGWDAASAALIILAAFLRATPLWWRRRAPYLTLAGLMLIDVVWLFTATRADSKASGLVILGTPAVLVAVYSVACYSKKGVHTWPSPFVAAIPWGVLTGSGMVMQSDTHHPAGRVAFGAVATFLLAALIIFPFWAWGKTVAYRGRRWESSALETMAARTGEAVLAERHRVSMGLRGTVLEHTSRLVHTAEHALPSPTDHLTALNAVTEHARAALLDMRALLDAMDKTPEGS
ncbi:sensor histidine kinase [Spirillospora sp. CA-294931]|uniref:sensor histidine kinase n=1 Tax=Spirillospora sp. CA-294931 TaxID=3240042 RepID=UPI003D90F8F7